MLSLNHKLIHNKLPLNHILNSNILPINHTLIYNKPPLNHILNYNILLINHTLIYNKPPLNHMLIQINPLHTITHYSIHYTTQTSSDPTENCTPDLIRVTFNISLYPSLTSNYINNSCLQFFRLNLYIPSSCRLQFACNINYKNPLRAVRCVQAHTLAGLRRGRAAV